MADSLLSESPPEFSHDNYLPVEISVERVEIGWRVWRWWCRHIKVRTLDVFWYRDALRYIAIPRLRVSDLGSIPTAVWIVVSPWDIALESLFHDEGYRYQPLGISRRDWDSMLFTMMEQRGKPSWVCWFVYIGVRFGGKHWWDLQARRNAEKAKS